MRRIWFLTLVVAWLQCGMGRAADPVIIQSARKLGFHAGAVRSLAFSPDGHTLASGSDDHLVRLWDVGAATARRVLPGHFQAVTTVAFSPDGTLLATGSTDATVKVWNVRSGAMLNSIVCGSAINCVAFSPDGKRLACAEQNGVVEIRDPATGHVLLTFKGHHDSVSFVTWAGEGQSLLSAGADKRVLAWDAATGEITADVTQPLPVLHYALSPNMDGVAGGEHQPVAFAPDGKLVARGDTVTVQDKVHGAIRIAAWPSTDALEPLAFFIEGKTSALVQSLAFSPNGHTLASGTEDGFIWLWDVAPLQQAQQPADDGPALANGGNPAIGGNDDGAAAPGDGQTDDNPAPNRRWPRLRTRLTGDNEVRIVNNNEFGITVGLRLRGAAGQGRDFKVPANDSAAVTLPDGRYDIYFVMANQPDALYQGDSFSLNQRDVSITINKVTDGNYGIHKVE